MLNVDDPVEMNHDLDDDLQLCWYRYCNCHLAQLSNSATLA